MDLQLNGRTALVTGASVGIGRGIAKALAAEGVRLALTARRIDKLHELGREIVAGGGAEPVCIEQDMLAADAAARIAQAASAGLGHVDILVNNAGGSRSFKELTLSTCAAAGPTPYPRSAHPRFRCSPGASGTGSQRSTPRSRQSMSDSAGRGQIRLTVCGRTSWRWKPSARRS